MRTFEVRDKAHKSGGEYVLGVEDTATHACYMIYGTLAPGEEGRLIKPGHGHEEIIIAVRGDIEVTGAHSGVLREGTAFHIAGDAECYLRNLTSADAVYIAAGGHTGHDH